jgi:predicted nicotinamide N-methyase
MSQALPSEAAAAQQPSHVTYSFSTDGDAVSIITLLESRSVIASSGTTGRRTWEAALHLGRYLTGPGSSSVRGKRILELGGGTGLVSIMCTRWLGAQHVTATDGDDGVIEDMQKNIFLNGLEGSDRIYAKSLKWGRMLEEDEGGQPPYFDVVLGADIVNPTIARVKLYEFTDNDVDIRRRGHPIFGCNL